MKNPKVGFMYWFTFWMMWLGGWLFPFAIFSVSALFTPSDSFDYVANNINRCLNIFMYILGIGLTGGIGGLLFDDFYPNNNSSHKRLGCMPALFWGAFWSIVYAIWFYYVVIPGSTYGVNSYWGLQMMILAPIIPIYTLVGGLFGTRVKKS